MSNGSISLMQLRNKPPAMILAGVVILILGVVLSDVPTMFASQNWPTTQGRIVSRILSGVSFEEYDGEYYTNIKGYVRYEYQVEGISYTATSINAINTRSYPYVLVYQYPEGKEVTVYYNLKDPSRAVLEPGFLLSGQAFSFFPTILVIAGISFFAAGLSNLWKWYQEKHR